MKKEESILPENKHVWMQGNRSIERNRNCTRVLPSKMSLMERGHPGISCSCRDKKFSGGGQDRAQNR